MGDGEQPLPTPPSLLGKGGGGLDSDANPSPKRGGEEEVGARGSDSLHTFRASDGYSFYYRHYPAAVPPRARLVFVHGIRSHGGWYTLPRKRGRERAIDCAARVLNPATWAIFARSR